MNACMSISAAIVSLDGTRGATAEINFIWSTREWSANGSTSSPPMPEDVASLTTELTYVGSGSFQSIPPSFFGTVEPIRDYTIAGYSPEWVGIEISGRNVKVLRYVAPTCAGSSKVTGACCDTTTGDCFLSEEQNCASPHTWLGAGTTCGQCSTSSSGGTLDFGDAPDTYATTVANDGPRHVVTAGVHLGKLIDAESGGQAERRRHG